jgi:hypothetical protein
MNFVFHLHLKGFEWGNSELTGLPTFSSRCRTVRFTEDSWETAKEFAKSILIDDEKAMGGNLCLDTDDRHVDTLNHEERRIISLTKKA